MKRASSKNEYRHAGISLIELVMFIVIVSVGVVGILSVMSVTTKASADPMVRKQALSIAESLLEEIQLQPFTFCDPDDANAATATSTAIGATGCATTAEVAPLGPEVGETRYTLPALPLFDNVNDYHTFSMSPIVDITNSAIPGLGAYTASVAITAVGAALFALPNDDVLQIDVRVQAGNTDITLTGYRFRYAPRAVP